MKEQKRTTRQTTAATPTAAVPEPIGDGDSANFPVVGIGASAGGLEALTEFFRALPLRTGMAFVVVTHLDPDHKSALTEILSQHTSLPISEVSDGVQLLVDRVYVIPPNTSMMQEGDRLRLAARPETRGPHLPVDVFLRSLAAARKNRAIGVILSGMGTDGTLGLKAIKGEGGITFAQDASAKFGAMPRSAMNADCVDFVLSPVAIVAELLRLGSHPYLSGGLQASSRSRETSDVPPKTELSRVQLQDDEDDFNTVVRLLSGAVGVDFMHYKPPTLRRRIERRMVLGQHSSLKDYVQFLKAEPTELQALYREVLIHVTHFFRDPDMFAALKATILPKLLEQRSDQEPLRIWVPGCATGEEVYSLAICALEFLKDVGRKTPVKIFATDIAEHAIAVARAGLYLDSIAAEVSPERLRRFFVKTEGHYQIQQSVRDLCVFARQDVTKDPPFSQIDIVSCRNVLIYLGPVLQYRVLPIFHYALRPNGVLVLGESESVGSFTELFSPLDKSHRFYRRQESLRRRTFDFAPSRTAGTGLALLELPGDPGRRLTEVQREADRLVLAKFAPAGVVVDDNLRVVQFRGQTGMYLQPAPGTPSLDLLPMARPGLLADLRSALEAAQRERVSQRRERVLVQTNGHSQEITLEVLPISVPESSQRFFVVLFEPSESNPKRQRGRSLPNAPDSDSVGSAESLEASALADASGYMTDLADASGYMTDLADASGYIADRSADLAARDREIERLKQELDATKSYLQSIIEAQDAANEELRAVNEEVVSSNEELQSTSEELETAKEELQATNEELTTINDELHDRIKVGSRLSDDLDNLIDAVNIPTIVLDHDMHIRRFSPSAQRVLSLIPTDIGRQFCDFQLKINVPDLKPLVQLVLDTLEVQQREVVDNEGRWHKLIVRPYKTLDHKIDGVILTLSDIDALKRREHEHALLAAHDQEINILKALRKIDERQRLVLEASRIGTFESDLVSGEGIWNTVEFELLGLKPGDASASMETLFRHVHPDDAERLNAQWVESQRTGRLDVEFRIVRADGQERWLAGNGRFAGDRQEGERPTRFLGVNYDITNRRRAEEQLQASTRLLRLVMDAVPNYVFAKNREGRFLFVNRFMAEKSGFTSPEEMVSCLERDTGIDLSQFDNFLSDDQRVIDSGLPLMIPMELKTDCHGQTVMLQTTKVPFPFPGTNEPAVLSVAVDVTELIRLQREVLDISSAEQRRIGQDLHDGIGQELTGLSFLAGDLEAELREKSFAEVTSAIKIVEGLDRALIQVRRISKGLLPVDITADGFQLGLRDLTETVTAQTKVTCRFLGSAEVSDSQSATHLYRIAQEAVSNSIKHSRATEITVSLADEADGVTLSVHDNGIGLTEPIAGASHLGLKIMHYRASLIGATLTIEASADKGTRLVCKLARTTKE